MQSPVVRYRIEDTDYDLFEVIEAKTINDAIHKYVTKYYTGGAELGDSSEFSVFNVTSHPADSVNKIARFVIYANGHGGYQYYETEILSVEE